jgi:DNA-binding NarL/FixJ family response regulator
VDHQAVAGGLSNAEAAAALYVSRKTVGAHLSRIHRSWGLRAPK